ncbi:MAG TPA: FAD-dependent oxidoreductase, partial [Pilimelia sp.]|nr:FAD-dependent oxidoreductase [Pilimelia sp.]
MTDDTVVVIGGGCSGVLVARELLRRPARTVVLVDPAAKPGRGVAYGAAAPWHLLNSPAGAMGADPERPGEFVAWCRARGHAVGPGDFLPRRWYGEYLRDVLRDLDATAPGRLVTHRARVNRVFCGAGPGLTVLLDRGVTIQADRVVLAVGQAAPQRPRGIEPSLRAHPRYVADPWAPGALAAIPADEPVLLVGTGLTAVDLALTLAQAGRRAPVVATSRHGLLPRQHRQPEAGPPVAGPPAP